ncbi:FAD-binding protein [Corynebacterium sp. zg-331]|uniref:FAD-binding oxidoreductase n=1 Tax=unclassified Corynebacterium TaxID=2624378 RepID=UPI00128D0650|nr:MULTISPECIES: FAD-linked oxidase C-terminal domain-containing protein [unclassified Corynebacterium]MBC3185081.1 FAD-binding protein [Corynebacterium sp. zg-331]MPV51581.1 FAD-binding protein [Corynebacterium sp. zg331]
MTSLILPHGRVLTAEEDMRPLTTDASQATPEGLPRAVAVARSTEDVSAALAWAHEHRVPVSVRAGGSGVSGGALAYEDGLVIALHEMNRIVEIDAPARLATVQAGVFTADLDAVARRHGLFFAPDPASAAISTVGGNIATNAGGLRCLAHGDTARAVAALKVVLASGEVITTGARTVKNSTGLNLTQLFVGSEGTLGVITEATVWLTPVPQGPEHSFLASFDSFEEAGRAVVDIVRSVELETLEFIDAPIAAMVERYRPSGLPQPGAALLIGQALGPQAARSVAAAADLCRKNGAARAETGEGNALLEARRLALPAMQEDGEWVMGDVGVPVPALPAMFEAIARIEKEEGQAVRIVAHAGDGNLHPMIRVEPGERARAQTVMDRIVAAAVELGGVISGEHGIGLLKQHELYRQYDEATLRAQHAIKAALDPRGILTPGRGI